MFQAEQLSFSVSAPGKVILHGEHSVVYSKTALAASINLRTTVRFTNNSNSPKIKLDLPCIDLYREFDVQELGDALLLEPVPLLEGVQQNEFNIENPQLIDFKILLGRMTAFLLRLEGDTALSLSQQTALLSFFCLIAGMFASVKSPLEKFHVKVTTDLSIGSGMGSSASYGTCMSAALFHYIRSICHCENGDMSKTRFKALKYRCSDLSAFDEREKRIISQWAYLSDRIMHGKPSGIDNTICTYGSILQFRKTSCGEEPEIKLIPNPKVLRILLINSGVTRDTAAMVSKVAKAKMRHEPVVEPILRAMDEVALEAADILRRLGQYQEGEEALEEDMTKLGELVNMNHGLLSSLGVSHPSLEKACGLMRAEGLPAKLTGAGGGGFAFTLLPTKADQCKTHAAREQLASHGFSFLEVELGGPGVRLDDTGEGKTIPGREM